MACKEKAGLKVSEKEEKTEKEKKSKRPELRIESENHETIVGIFGSREVKAFEKREIIGNYLDSNQKKLPSVTNHSIPKIYRIVNKSNSPAKNSKDFSANFHEKKNVVI